MSVHVMTIKGRIDSEGATAVAIATLRWDAIRNIGLYVSIAAVLIVCVWRFS